MRPHRSNLRHHHHQPSEYMLRLRDPLWIKVLAPVLGWLVLAIPVGLFLLIQALMEC
jgi:hypothetical protein